MEEPWRLGAEACAAAIRSGRLSAVAVTESVLARVAAVNPHINAIVDPMAEEALTAAAAADRALRRGEIIGPLHGVPVTVKINVDCRGRATTNGVAAFQELIAAEDSPPVAALRRSGAILIGRTNTPAFSMRWFTNNALHGRTLNPFAPDRTPGGSSGGAAAAVATGMGALAHGNDYGGSIRYPAYACGVAGLRPSLGRVPAFNATAAAERTLTNQLMSVQGPLARTVADCRLGLAVLAVADPRDPNFTPAPLTFPAPARKLRAALFTAPAGAAVDAAVEAAVEKAGAWLAEAGSDVIRAAPPHFEEASALWRSLVYTDLRLSSLATMERLGDEPLRRSLKYSMRYPSLDFEGFLAGLARRFTLARAWSLFLSDHDVLVLPTSFRLPFPVDADIQSEEEAEAVLAAQAPLLAPALLGLPGLSVPVGLAEGVPVGVQIVAGRFREDLCCAAGEVIERAAAFSALAHLDSLPVAAKGRG
jgi:amidase